MLFIVALIQATLFKEFGVTTMGNVLNSTRKKDSGCSAECAVTDIEVGAKVAALFVEVIPVENAGREANKDTQACYEHHQGRLGLELSVIALVLLNWGRCGRKGN